MRGLDNSLDSIVPHETFFLQLEHETIRVASCTNSPFIKILISSRLDKVLPRRKAKPSESCI
jgi:hypothetical protein